MIDDIGEKLASRPYNCTYIENPSQDELKRLARICTPAIIETSSGSINKVSRNKARMAKYTYIIEDGHEEKWSHQTITAEKAQELVDAQCEYIENSGTLIAIDGNIGLGNRAVSATWLYTPEGANIAGMQQILAFPCDEDHYPDFTVVYTPGFRPAGMPGNQAILVDLETWTTYVMGPDYFGESKKAMLRMLNHLVYLEGGLVLHAGAKAVMKKDGSRILMTVMGLSGTGKTTTTFSKQGDITEPVQDDMVCLWPGGELSITENGCFAKIEGLTSESEPIIFAGTVSGEAWLENAFIDLDGEFDFDKRVLSINEVKKYKDILVKTGADETNIDMYINGEVHADSVLDERGIPSEGWDFVSWTRNGRSIIPMSSIPGAANLEDLPDVRTMGILNRDEGRDACTPGIVRFTSPEQAAGFFMLGETSKTSAAGKDRGKTRSPFTQPFFPARMGLQAERFRELARTMPGVDMWLMNTGYVGGSANDGEAIKVKIKHSSAMLEALLANEIVWKLDPDFGYEVVDTDAPQNSGLLEKVPLEILSPCTYYKDSGRFKEYVEWVYEMKKQRTEFLRNHGVSKEIIDAISRTPESE